jgi:hypothetical protein
MKEDYHLTVPGVAEAVVAVAETEWQTTDSSGYSNWPHRAKAKSEER